MATTTTTSIFGFDFNLTFTLLFQFDLNVCMCMYIVYDGTSETWVDIETHDDLNASLWILMNSWSRPDIIGIRFGGSSGGINTFFRVWSLHRLSCVYFGRLSGYGSNDALSTAENFNFEQMAIVQSSVFSFFIYSFMVDGGGGGHIEEFVNGEWDYCL